MSLISATTRLSGCDGHLLKEYGFEYHCVSFLATATATFEDVLLSNRLPQEWLKLYAENEYVHDDPGFNCAKAVVQPFRWFKEAPYDPERDPRAAEGMQLAADFGVLDGFVIPVASTAGRMGQIRFGGRSSICRGTNHQPCTL